MFGTQHLQLLGTDGWSRERLLDEFVAVKQCRLFLLQAAELAMYISTLDEFGLGETQNGQPDLVDLCKWRQLGLGLDVSLILRSRPNHTTHLVDEGYAIKQEDIPEAEPCLNGESVCECSNEPRGSV